MADAGYERARQSALSWLERGLHLGGRLVSRDELHERILTEDMSPGRSLSGVRIVNPFAKGRDKRQ